MDRIKDVMAREGEVAGMVRSFESNARLLLDLLPQIRNFMEGVPAGLPFPAADTDGSYRALRMRISIALGDAITMTEKVQDTARDLLTATDGTPLTLEEPDRSDENWEERHAEYLGLMAGYCEALDAAHAKYVEMDKHYKRYIKPYREALWGSYASRGSNC